MTAAIKFKSTVTADHTVRLPAEVPEGPVEIIVLVEPAGEGRQRAEQALRRLQSMGADAGRLVVPEDFDEPLPPEVVGEFEGSGPVMNGR